MSDDTVGRIVLARAANPGAIAEAAATRARRADGDAACVVGPAVGLP